MAIVKGNNNSNILYGSSNTDSIYGYGGNDRLYGFDGNDYLSGGNGNDTLYGGIDNDTLYGNDGNDVLYGDSGVYGGGGNDTIYGGAGTDTLSGDNGADTLIGGINADIFYYQFRYDSGSSSSSRDTITDFKRSEGDKISLNDMDANSLKTGDQDFKYIGTANFNSAGQVRFDPIAHILYASDDGDTAAEFSIQLTGVSSLQASDLILWNR